MYDCYCRIFTRLGLKFRAVLADTGNIGGSQSQEFQVLAQTGEDQIFYSDSSDYAANAELAESLEIQQRPAPTAPLKKEKTPDKKTIAAVSDYLKISPQQSIKLLIVKGTHHPLVGLILRGDHELNPTKASKLTEVAHPLSLADEADIVAQTRLPLGYLGPIGLSIPLIVDRAAAVLADFVCGANEKDSHLTHVNWERDCPLPPVADLRQVQIGDPSPDGKGHLKMERGIEVGHIFQLGNKYSRAMGATITTEDGSLQPMEMGCYGIGVSRIVGAAIEQNHDALGIIWPLAMAPFQVVIIPVAYHRSDEVKLATDTLYRQLDAAGFEILLDDRDERPGLLFADNDLIGIPHRLVISEKNLKTQMIEYKKRTEQSIHVICRHEIIDFLTKQLTVN